MKLKRLPGFEEYGEKMDFWLYLAVFDVSQFCAPHLQRIMELWENKVQKYEVMSQISWN